MYFSAIQKGKTEGNVLFNDTLKIIASDLMGRRIDL